MPEMLSWELVQLLVKEELAAVTLALESPLLNDNDITGARQVLLNITVGSDEILMDEIMEITDYIQDAAGQSADVIRGYAIDENLTEDVCVTVIATGFEAHEITTTSEPVAPRKIIHKLGDEATEVTKAVETPVSTPEEEPVAEAPQTDLFSDSSDVEETVEADEEVQEIQDVQDDQLTEEVEEEKIIHNLDDTPALTENVEPEISVTNEEPSTPEFTTSTADAACMEENKKKAREAFLER